MPRGLGSFDPMRRKRPRPRVRSDSKKAHNNAPPPIMAAFALLEVYAKGGARPPRALQCNRLWEFLQSGQVSEGGLLINGAAQLATGCLRVEQWSRGLIAELSAFEVSYTLSGNLTLDVRATRYLRPHGARAAPVWSCKRAPARPPEPECPISGAWRQLCA